MDRLESYFDEYFPNVTKTTARNLFLIIVSILALDIFRSVRFAYRHVLSKLSGTSLNTYYYVLKTGRMSHVSWRDVTVSKALRTVPAQLRAQPLFHFIDNTMAEKEGGKFGLRPKLFDHAVYNGSNYLNRHCMVSILLSFSSYEWWLHMLPFCPAWLPALGQKTDEAGNFCWNGAPGYGHHWLTQTGVLACDSWCPKGCVANLVNGYHSLNIICNARIDTAMYGLPPGRTGKHSRPKEYGVCLSPEDLGLECQKTGVRK